MPMHVLGKCMHRYQNFLNDHDAIILNVNTVILTNRTFFGGPKDWCCENTGDRCASYNELAKKSDPIMKDFHEKLCKKITQDGGDYCVVLFGDHAWSVCANWFPAEKVINRGSIAHGSVIRNNWHWEQAWDDFLITIDRASAFLSGIKPIPFMDSDKGDYLHIGNDLNSLAGNVGDMSATSRRHGKMSPIFIPTGEIWRHGMLCVSTLLCRDFFTLMYHEQRIFGQGCY
jgi:hypothetical protein